MPTRSAGISRTRAAGTRCSRAGAPAGRVMRRWSRFSRRASPSSRFAHDFLPAFSRRSGALRGRRHAAARSAPLVGTGRDQRSGDAGQPGGPWLDLWADRRRRPGRRRLGPAVDLGPADRRRPGRAARLGAFRLMRYTRVHTDVHEYDVFARKTRVEPLHQVGSVVAPDDDLAMAYARATYDE